MSIVTDKDTIFVDELIRENARLTVQHEADQQRILALCDRVEQLEQEEGSGIEASEICEKFWAEMPGIYVCVEEI